VIACGAVEAWSEVAAIADAAEREDARAMLREVLLHELTQDQQAAERMKRAVGPSAGPNLRLDLRPPVPELHRDTAAPDVSHVTPELIQLVLEGQARMEGKLDRLQTDVSQIGKLTGLVHSQLRSWTLTYETTNGTPRLFTLTPVSRRGLDKAAVWQDTYRLTLWCEYDDQPHPWQPAEYKFHRPRDWLVTVAPYALVVLKILRLAVNVAAPIATGPIATLADVDLESVRDDLDAMDKLLDQLPPHRPDTLAASGQAAQSIQAEGPELRALRALLTELDPNRTFNGMHVVATSSGDIRWVCQDHKAAYNLQSGTDSAT
jgi:internalin A